MLVCLDHHLNTLSDVFSIFTGFIHSCVYNIEIIIRALILILRKQGYKKPNYLYFLIKTNSSKTVTWDGVIKSSKSTNRKAPLKAAMINNLNIKRQIQSKRSGSADLGVDLRLYLFVVNHVYLEKRGWSKNK